MQVELEKSASNSEVLLKVIVDAYNTKPHTPELVTRFWQTFLETSIKTQGLHISIPTILCDRTQEELEALKEDGRMWVPEARLTYSRLGRIFPKIGNHAREEDSPIVDELQQDAKGVDVEVSIDSPNRNTNETDLEELFKSQGRKGMRLSTFILASQASQLLRNKFSDGGITWSRVLGSRRDGRVGHVHFKTNGRLLVDWHWYPEYKHPDLGGRSEGVKKA